MGMKTDKTKTLLHAASFIDEFLVLISHFDNGDFRIQYRKSTFSVTYMSGVVDKGEYMVVG